MQRELGQSIYLVSYGGGKGRGGGKGGEEEERDAEVVSPEEAERKIERLGKRWEFLLPQWKWWRWEEIESGQSLYLKGTVPQVTDITTGSTQKTCSHIVCISCRCQNTPK